MGSLTVAARNAAERIYKDVLRTKPVDLGSRQGEREAKERWVDYMLEALGLALSQGPGVGEIEQLIAAAAAYEKAYEDLLSAKLVGREVTLKYGPYTGRRARIEHVYLFEGELFAIVEVYWLNGIAFLSPTSRKDGRIHYRWSEFELEDESQGALAVASAKG